VPGSRVIRGERIGGTPVLIVNHEPIWDRVTFATTPVADTPVYVEGQVTNANAVNGTRRTNIDTALVQGARLPTPQFFDCIGVTITVRRSAVNTGDTDGPIGILDLMRWVRHLTYRFKVGPTTHLQELRADLIPSGPDIDGFAGNIAMAAARVGKGFQGDQYPLIVPEEMSLPNGANVYTGRKAPIKILPNEQFEGNLHIEAAALADLFDRALAAVVTTWGFKKIEK
jgi:hypothetical protein